MIEAGGRAGMLARRAILGCVCVSLSLRGQNPSGRAIGHGTVAAGSRDGFTPSRGVVFARAPQAVVSAASATPSGIVYTCDSSIYTLSATACDTLNTTIAALYKNAFTNANTNIYVEAQSGNFFANSNYQYGFYAYGAYSSAAAANDAIAAQNLPSANPYPADSVGVVSALERALGLANPCGSWAGITGCYDGIVTVNAAEPWYFRSGPISPSQFDFFTVVEHETDEILGTGSCAFGCGSVFFPPDVYRYHSDGTRSFAPGTNASCSSPNSTNACFSLDGVTMLHQYNNIPGQDAGDWVPNCDMPLVQDYAICAGTAGVDISPAAEILVLSAIGYTPRVQSNGVTPSGIILKSPDGTKCARISLNNTGALVTTSLACP
jgi:hypothetical protein